mmetsp:Transcript_68544/g.164014  ORF Transcript_68544/g.164014 Transcript_68544/m.164014 type:complete len:200 (+) Transcript_68544:126-725(+)
MGAQLVAPRAPIVRLDLARGFKALPRFFFGAFLLDKRRLLSHSQRPDALLDDLDALLHLHGHSHHRNRVSALGCLGLSSFLCHHRILAIHVFRWIVCRNMLPALVFFNLECCDVRLLLREPLHVLDEFGCSLSRGRVAEEVLDRQPELIEPIWRRCHVLFQHALVFEMVSDCVASVAILRQLGGISSPPPPRPTHRPKF